jgi:hypothetical protein
VEWEGQKPEAVQKLRDKLDAEFEYTGNPLSMQGFRNAVKRYLKSERLRLKIQYRLGDTTNPVHIQPAQWKQLKQYWDTEKQVLKSAKMVDARSKIKYVSVVGRKSKARQQALAVSSIFLFFVHRVLCDLRASSSLWACEEYGGEPWHHKDWSSPPEFRCGGVPYFSKLSKELNSISVLYVRPLDGILNRSISEVVEEM